MDLGLRGKKAVISGASKGIGRAVAEMLAEEGCDVTLVSRTAADLEAARSAIAGKYNVGVRVFALDLSDSRNVDRVAAECPGHRHPGQQCRGDPGRQSRHGRPRTAGARPGTSRSSVIST